MHAKPIIKYVGLDADNIPRVWGEGTTKKVAESQCRQMAMEYVKRRPDTGPLDKWTILAKQP